MKKRILSLFLALGLLLSLLPTAALAVGSGTDSVPVSSEAAAAPVEAESTGAVKGGGGGGLVWHSAFEGENSLLGWQIIDANADGHTFARVQDPYTGAWCMSSNEEVGTGFTPCGPDEYLITPQIDLTESGCEYTLGIKGGVTSGGSLAGYYIYVYTGTELLRPDNLYTLLGQHFRFDVFSWSDWSWSYFDLSAYAGQTVQIVIRRADEKKSDNALKIAGLSVSYQEPDEQLAKVTALNVPLPELGVNVETLMARESEITFPAYANYELVPGSLTYYKYVGEDGEEMHDQVFTEDGYYNLRFRVRPKAGIEIYDQGCASVNGYYAQYTYFESTGEILIDFWTMPPLVPPDEVSEVNIRVTPPVVDTVPNKATERWLADGSTDYHYTVEEWDWEPPNTEIFQSGESYGIFDGIILEDGYTMAENPHFTVNREPAVAMGPDDSGEWHIVKSFHADYKTPIEDASIWLEKPRADIRPGYSSYSSEFRVVSCDWYPVDAYGEVQPALGEGETLEPAASYWICFGLEPTEDYGFAGSTRVSVRGTEAVFYQEDDGVWYYCMPMKTRSKDPITVTFNAHGHGTAPDPIEIPYGSSLWDGYYNLNDLRMENTDGLFFWGWSEYSTDRRDDRISWEQELYDDTTLYAVWLKEYDSLTLYVDQPIFMDPIDKPITSLTNDCLFKPEPLGWWASADGYSNGDPALTGTFKAGTTYYGVVRIESDLYSFLPEGGDVVSVLGANKVREDWVDATELNPNDGPVLYVTFSVTVPKRGMIDEIDLLVDIGWPGWLKNGTPPTQICTTAGVGLSEGSWWENLEDVGDESKALTAPFPTDCLIYTDLQAFPSLNCTIADNPTVNIDGGTLVRTEPGASGSLHIIYSVWSPAYHGMEFRSQGSGWFLVDDDPHAHKWHEGPFFETGTHTVTAVPDPGWHFKGWYEGRDADVLVSTYPVYVFKNEPSDEDLCLTVVFEEGVPSIDRIEIEVPVPFAGDSFNWETESAGAGVVNDAPVRITEDKWYNEWGISGNPLPFEEGQNYFVGIELVANAGYQITEDTVILINREEVAWKQQSNVTTWSVSSRNYTMQTPIPVELVEIEVPIPAAGNSFYWSTDSAGAWITNDAEVWISGSKWYTEGGISADPLIFELGKKYFVEIQLKDVYPHQITEDTVFRINGEEVPWKQHSNVTTWSIASRNYTMEAAQEIGTMDIQLHHIPAAGEVFDWNYDVVNASTMAQIEWRDSSWCEVGCPGVSPLTFVEGGQYTAYFTIRGKDGFVLTDDTVATVDGVPARSWDHLGGGWYGLETPIYTVHAERVIPAVEVYANKPVYDIAPDSPYIPDYMCYSVEDWYWSDANDVRLPNDFTVVGGAEYTLTVMVKPEEGYMFSADELTAHMFWDDAEIVSAEPHLLTLRGTCTAGMGTPNPFVDVKKGDYFYEGVIWAYYHDPQITKGTDATHFSPKKNCTRGEVVTFLWRAAGCPAPASTENPFSDVLDGKWYTDAILWAVEQGITKGVGGGKFGLLNTCTRAEVVTFLWRAARSPAPVSTENPFSDVPDGKWYTDAILWAVEQGITNGDGAGGFRPSISCTRAQVVTFLYRAFGPKG